MKLTPEILAAAYEFLRTTRPFSGWDLPDAEDMKFEVSKAKLYGYNLDRKNTIGVSTYRVGRTDCLMETMAHEMVHLHLDRFGVRSHHGRPFMKAARQICNEHGFDIKRFI